MKRTEATWEALRRDEWRCQWHLLELGVDRQASDGHHIYGRQVDEPAAIVALCHECHMQLHNGQIDREKIVRMQISRGVLSESDARQFFFAKIGGTKAAGWGM